MNKTDHKPKIIIATTTLGGGHMAAAKALIAAINTKYSDRCEVELVDVLADQDLRLPLPIDKIAVSGYSNSVRMLKSYPYKLFFDFSNVNHKLIKQFFTTIFKDKSEAFMRAKDPDLIVSTFPIVSYAAGRIVSDNWHKPVPIISIVTDAGDVHKLWLFSPHDDILVSTPETIDYAVRLGVERERLHYLGFPVDLRFTALPSKQVARAELGLEDKPTVFLTGGGLGLSTKLVALCKRLAKQSTGAQYLIIGGRNQRLVEDLKAIRFIDTARVFGFVDNVPQLLAASDLFVGKAGWLHLYEAMIARRPMVIIDVIPGQEEPNAEFVEKHGVGQIIRNPSDAAEAISGFVTHPETLQKYERAFDRLNLDPYAAEKIADFIVGKLP